MTAAIQATGICRQFGGLQALTDVELDVGEAECLGVVGPNGAGKTTMLNVLCGQVRPDRGRVFAQGVDITSRHPAHPARRGILRTHQGSGMFARLSARENVALAAMTRHQSSRAALQAAGGALETLGLAPVADSRVSRLSGGQQKLVDFARTLVTEPRVVLLDEPTAGVSDAMAQVLTREIRRHQNESGCAFVIISHDLRWAFDLCPRVTVLVNGRNLRTGTPEEIRSDHRVIEAYLG